MIKFEVRASYMVYFVAEIEAKDEEHAWEIAKEMEGDDFEDTGSDWQIDYVEEVI